MTIQVPGEPIVLEAVWQTGELGGAVVAPPHPQYGGSLENPVVNELAYGLHRADVPSLRFNWRGVGASQGEITGDLAAAESDYRAALEHLAASADPPLLACGYSFGAGAALRVAAHDARVARLILVAPPVGMLGQLAGLELEIPVHVIVGEEDAFAPVAPLGEWMQALPAGELEVLPGVDHFFMSGGLVQVSHFATRSVRP